MILIWIIALLTQFPFRRKKLQIEKITDPYQGLSEEQFKARISGEWNNMTPEERTQYLTNINKALSEATQHLIEIGNKQFNKEKK